MGSYYELHVAGFVVEYNKNYLPSHVTVPFDNADRVRENAEEDEPERHVYKATARTVARRLDLLGYTRRRAAREFAEGYAQLDDWELPDIPGDLRCASGFETWRTLVKLAVDAAAADAHMVAEEQSDERLRFMLGSGDHYLGFPRSGNPLTVLRAVVDVADPTAPVVLNLTDLISGGWAAADSLDEHEDRQPLIIVTEGKSDSRFLRRALEALTPEFKRFTTFIDFETANARGGTDELVQFVRMLIGCGIRNRIAVLFDNDAAGHEALQRLRELTIPSNVFAMTLPVWEPARSYPTLGPDGPSLADINGRACSIELYLGDDVLEGADGGRLPVRWTGFNEKMQRYQGQIAQKGLVHERFDKKLTEWVRRPGASPAPAFSGVLAIFDTIFDAVAER